MYVFLVASMGFRSLGLHLSFWYVFQCYLLLQVCNTGLGNLSDEWILACVGFWQIHMFDVHDCGTDKVRL